MDKKTLAIIILVTLVVGITIGFLLATEIILDKLTNIVPQFAHVEVDKEVIREAIFRYNNNLGSNCQVGL